MWPERTSGSPPGESAPRHPDRKLGGRQTFVHTREPQGSEDILKEECDPGSSSSVGQWIGRWLPIAVLAAVSVTYVSYWSWIDLLRLFTLHLPVYDFGVSFQVIWAAAHYDSISISGPSYTNGVLLLFVPVYSTFGGSISGFFIFLLTFQNVFLALGVVPVYLLTRDRLCDRWLGALLGVSYLLYVPAVGIVFFPFHAEGLFPALFLFGYLFYRRRQLLLSLTLFLLAATTEIGALAVLVCFAIGIVVEPTVARLRAGRKGPRQTRWRTQSIVERFWFPGSLVIGSLGLFGIYVLIGGASNIVAFALHSPNASLGHTVGVAVPLGGILAHWQVKAVSLGLIFGPLLGLPFLAREERWALIPYVGLLTFSASFGIFSFPFRDQYTALLLGPVFAATVRGVERIQSHLSNSDRRSAHSPRPRRLSRCRPRPRTLAEVGVAIAIVVSLFFAPWGPFNGELSNNQLLAGGYYNLGSLTAGNESVAAQIGNLEALIPPEGWLLTQNDLPATTARAQFILPGFYNLNVPLNYLITNPYGNSFYPGTNFGPYNTSMLYWANYYLAQGWSVGGESSGALFLSKAPVPLQEFVPLTQKFVRSEFLCCSVSADTQPLSNFTGYYLSGLRLPLTGAYSVLSPGTYNITTTLDVNNPNSQGSVSLQIGSQWGGHLLQFFNHGAENWTTESGLVQISDHITIREYYEGMFLALYLYDWSGPIQFVSMQVEQTAPI